MIIKRTAGSSPFYVLGGIMAKAKKSIFFCQNCGHEESKWLGQCPMCKEWNSFVEEKVSQTKGTTVKDRNDAQVVSLSSVSTEEDERMQTNIKELDRVLGGGIVQGSLVLVGGDPGIGKSTLLLQVCQKLSAMKKKVLGKSKYVKTKTSGSGLKKKNKPWEQISLTKKSLQTISQ
jgi:predicted ATP-dependent serine protease